MKRILLCAIFFAAAIALAAQDADESAYDSFPELTAEQHEIKTALQAEQLLELDISTSTLMELASWCRSLGLSEGGTKDDLANRLRSYFGLPARGGTVSEGRKTIIIESARATEYFTLDIVDEEYARLTGDVAISLKDGDAVHRVTAWEILYNRTRNIMTASGGVVYTKEEGNTVETFRGESITVNLDNWSSIFLDGVSERGVSSNDTAYRFSGTVISQNSEGVTVLTGAEITNGHNPEALWSLKASKLWLLPGSDWAILNAVLKVGNIPVLWLPFFYYPSDEIVFHPVLGNRSREGAFIQTTTYILGRPKTSTSLENSITKIFGSTPDGDKIREGLFLRATGKKAVNIEEPRLSVLFDAYTNLGFYLGTDFFLPRKGNFGAFNLSFGIGFTRNIYQVSFGSTPFPNFDGSSEWNKSNLFSLKVPFRYRLEVTGSYSFRMGSLNWNIPFYSDPYVNRDFLNRTEILDWLAMLRDSSESSTKSITDTYMSSFEMRLNASFTPRLPKLAPYIQSLSVSGITSSLSFASRTTSPRPPSSGISFPANPGDMFFFPNKLTILSVSSSMSGTLYSNSAQSVTPRTGEEKLDELILPATPVSPWEKEGDAESALSGGDLYTLSPPALGQRFSIGTAGRPQISISYNLNPSAASELQFHNDASNWKNSGDIDWSDVQSVLTRIRSDFGVGVSLSHSGGNAYSGSFRLTGTGAWQNYNYLNDAIGASAVSSARRRAYSETYFTSSYSLSATVRPFYRHSVWGNTSFSYDLRGIIAKTVFDATNVTNTSDEPAWNWEFAGWTKEKLDTHSLSARVEASFRDQLQSILISSVLPPKEPSITENATFRLWISETRIRNTITEPFSSSKRVVQPIYFTEVLRFTNWFSIEQNLAFDPEISRFISLSSILNLWRFNAKFQMAHISPYVLNHNRTVDPSKPAGWIQVGDKKFVPQELSFSYSRSFPKKEMWYNGPLFSAGISTSLIFDLQRYTYSKFNLSLSFGLEISNFLTVNFSTSSENAQIYKYFRKWPFFPNDVPLPYGTETNIFVDLFNSFRFGNDDMRRQSAFKLKSFKFDLDHNLGDWNATLGITLSPYLDRTSPVPSWRFNNQISFTVRWAPIEEIRTEISADKDIITFK